MHILSAVNLRINGKHVRWSADRLARIAGIPSSGGPDHADHHTDIPLHCAHTLVEVASPLVCGGGTTANVGDAACAMGWPQCWGSGTKRGRTGVQMRTGGGMGAREAKEGKKEEEGSRWEWARAMQGRCMCDVRAPHRRCTEDPMGLTVAATRIRS